MVLGLLAAAHPLVHVNASLNGLAAMLLVLGLILIRRRQETAHQWVMIASFCVSSLFLACYLWYHYHAGHVPFAGTGTVRLIYFLILVSHVLLAMTVPPLAMATIYLGWRATRDDDKAASYRPRHRRLARWTFPIWLYVSVTGVIVYVMLYHIWSA